MVVCKYFQQGTCRFGQYCRFEHINPNFASNQANQGNGNKPFVEGKNIVLGVAEEVLTAERGGQWLLSCFGPFKEQPCIPGMEDVSPEEVRWEMYQAQKNGTVDQTKLQFQQLCQAMTAKREALKNPSHETAAMLEKLQKTNRDSGFASSMPQMGQSGSAASGSSVFGVKPFGTASNTFGSGFSSSVGGSTSIFSRPGTSSTSVFGGKPSFGGTAVFGGQTSGSSVFGGSTGSTTSSSVFGSSQGGMQTFATANSTTSNSVFGGGTTGQTVFAQPTTFGTTSQATGPFSTMSQATTTSSVFGTTTVATTAATSSPFGAPALFGAAAQASQPHIFGGGATIQPVGSIFGSSTGTPTTTAFGGAPVFGAGTGFGSQQTPVSTGSIFGGQATFENPTMPASNVFASTQATTFGANSAQTSGTFGALAAPGAFGVTAVSTTSSPFGTGSPFARNSAFGNTIQPTKVEFTATTTTESPFAPATGAFGTLQPPPPPASQPFGTPAFGNTPSTPFASTTSTTTTSNPFAPRSQQQVNSPFAQTTMSSGTGVAFGQPASFGSITTALIIDETAYTPEGKLTDDEKTAYMSDRFALGKIPINPPTIELR